MTTPPQHASAVHLVMPIPSDHLPHHQTLEVSKVADQIREHLDNPTVWFTRDSLRLVTEHDDVTAGPGDRLVIEDASVRVVSRAA